MTSLDLAFAACGLLAVVAGLLAVTTRQVVHAALFAALALTGRTAGIPAVTLLPALVGYAAVSEVLQGLLPIGRSCDVVDGLVDVAGAAIGWAVVALTRKVSGGSSP